MFERRYGLGSLYSCADDRGRTVAVYGPERGCADFLAGRTEESTPEEILMLIQHLVKLLPPEYQARLAGQEREEELERASGC